MMKAKHSIIRYNTGLSCANVKKKGPGRIYQTELRSTTLAKQPKITGNIFTGLVENKTAVSNNKC